MTKISILTKALETAMDKGQYAILPLQNRRYFIEQVPPVYKFLNKSQDIFSTPTIIKKRELKSIVRIFKDNIEDGKINGNAYIADVAKITVPEEVLWSGIFHEPNETIKRAAGPGADIFIKTHQEQRLRA